MDVENQQTKKTDKNRRVDVLSENQRTTKTDKNRRMDVLSENQQTTKTDKNKRMDVLSQVSKEQHDLLSAAFLWQPR